MASISKILVLLAGIVGLNVAALASVLEAKKNGVEVKAKPKRSAPALATLKKGETVNALERKGMYWKVKAPGGQEGFVMFTKVKRRSGGSKDSLAKAIQSAARASRDMDNVKGARSRSAVMGVRGLDEGGNTASAGNVQPNLRLVYAMEDLTVSERRIGSLERAVQREIEAKMNRRGDF